MEFDPMLMGDEDNDGWPDAMDECPATPLGVVTDSTGVPWIRIMMAFMIISIRNPTVVQVLVSTMKVWRLPKTT